MALAYTQLTAILFKRSTEARLSCYCTLEERDQTPLGCVLNITCREGAVAQAESEALASPQAEKNDNVVKWIVG